MLELYIDHMGARALPPYQIFLKDQKTYVNGRYRRLLGAQGHESPGIKLLRYILQFVDINYLDTQSNNYDRYSYHLRYIRRDLMNIFDRVQRGGGYHNLFLAPNRFITEEYLLPVEDTNAISNLPLASNSWEDWRLVKPLRFWASDSKEYTINLMNDSVHYTGMPPGYCVELLDVIALVFKYYFWLKQQRMNETAEELALLAPQQLFLHKYVFCDWCWDLTDAWLMNIFADLLNSTEDDFDYRSLCTDDQWGWIAITSKNAFRYLQRLFIESTSRNMRPEVIFDSRILMQGTIYDRMTAISTTLELPPLQQYDWLRWLRDKSLYRLYCGIWRLRFDLPTARSHFVNWRRDFKRTLNHRPWNYCNNILLKNSIEEEMTQFYEWLDATKFGV